VSRTADLLANVERGSASRPVPAADHGDPLHGWWPGGAGAEVERWKRRALAAEGELRAVRAEIAADVRRRRGFAT
jgi:hypothetical protein